MANSNLKWADRRIVKLPGHIGTAPPVVGCRAAPGAIEMADTLAGWIKAGKLALLVHDAPGYDPVAYVQAGGIVPERVTITLLCDMDVEGAISQVEHLIELNDRALADNAPNYSDN